MECTTLSLARFEMDFISFNKELYGLRKKFPNKFVAYVNGKIISSKDSIEEVKKDLISKGIEPSEIVIEFISRDEIRVIV